MHDTEADMKRLAPLATRWLIAAASFVVIVAGIRAATEIVVPLLLAAFIAVVCTPMQIGLQRRGVPSIVAVLLIVLLAVALGAVAVGLLSAPLRDLSGDLPRYRARLQEQTDDLMGWLKSKGIQAPELTGGKALEPQALVRHLGALVRAISSTLGDLFLILLVAVFILLEATVLPAKVQALPGLSDAAWGRICETMDGIRRYVALKTVVSLATGILVTVWLLVVGVRHAVPLGLLAFLLNYVPNIGSFIAAVPGVALALLDGGPGTAVVTGAGYVVINVSVGNVVEPRLLGRGLGLSPLTVLVALIFWGWVLGPMGMLLSVPLTMAVKIALEGSDGTRWLALLMSSGGEQER